MEDMNECIAICADEIIDEECLPESNDSKVSQISRFELSTLECKIMLNYILKLYNNQMQDESISVIEFLSSTSTLEIIFKKLIVDFNPNMESYDFMDPLYLIQIRSNNKNYFISVQTIMEKPNHGLSTKHNFITLVDIHNGSLNCSEVIRDLRVKSLRHSIYNKKVMTIKREPYMGEEIIECVKITNVRKISLNELYIPELKKEQFTRFTNAILNWENDKISMRYLLSGPPGTGKSQLINTVINQLKDQVTTFIMTNISGNQGRDISFNEIFDFCNNFGKCLLVIDDLDLYFSDRERNYNRKELQFFLSFMDGYVQNNLFILASTNDKKMVDIAASRPGRFDLVLDIEEINPSNYQSLILRETDDEQIISFFNSELLSSLAVKKVTGAYIVSFIKQLKSLKRSKGEIDKKDFEDYLNLTYNGFYKSNAENLKAVGF